MELFNIICGVCSVIGLLVSLFTAGTVVKMSNNIGNMTVRDSGNVTIRDSENVKNTLKNSTVNGDFHGGHKKVNGRR